MNRKIRDLVYAALIAALYAVLTHYQNLLLPGTTTWAIQCRLSETLCILAFFTPAAIPGLTLGCLIFNITYAASLPLDWIIGTLATFVAAASMWLLRNVKIRNFPFLGMLMPAVSNAFLVGGELTIYFGGGFWINALYVALGELIVLLIPGSLLYYAMTYRHLDTKLFS